MFVRPWFLLTQYSITKKRRFSGRPYTRHKKRMSTSAHPILIRLFADSRRFIDAVDVPNPRSSRRSSSPSATYLDQPAGVALSTPTAFAIAFVIAGVIGMLLISPTPFAPNGPDEISCSRMNDLISGVCLMLGIL